MNSEICIYSKAAMKEAMYWCNHFEYYEYRILRVSRDKLAIVSP